MKFMNKAIVIAFVALLAGNLLSAAGLPKGKKTWEEVLEKFQEMSDIKITEDNAARMAIDYGNKLRKYYEYADDYTKAVMFEQVQDFIRTAMSVCVKDWSQVKKAIKLYIIDNHEVPFDERLRDQLKSEFGQIVNQKELSWIEEGFKPGLQGCSNFFLSERPKESPELKKAMLKKLESLIKRGGPVFERAVKDGVVSVDDFIQYFAEPIHEIVVQVGNNEETYDEGTREAVEKKFQESVDWYYENKDQQPESSWKQYVGPVLTGMMLTAGAIGAYNQMSSASGPNTNVAASGLEVDDQAVPAAGNQKADTSAPLVDVSDVEVVHQPSVAAPQVIVPAPDAIDLMRAGTTTGTKVVLPVGQSYGPRPTLGESVKNMVTGNTPPAFYDPVQHSGFDINKVQETKQAEERQAAEEAKVEKEKRQAEKDRRWAESEERAAKLDVGFRKINEIGQEKIKATMIEQNHLPKDATVSVGEWSKSGGLIPNEDNAHGLRVTATFTYKDSDGCQISVPCIFEEGQGGVYGSREYLGRTGVARNIALEKFKQQYPGVEKLSIYSDVERNQDAYSRGEINNSDIMVVIQVPEWSNAVQNYYVEPQEINQKMSELTGSSSSWKFW